MVALNQFKTSGILCTLLCLIFVAVSYSQDSALVSFKLKDQFDNVYTDGDFKGNIVIVVGSDKEGSRYNEEWSLAIYDTLKRIGKENSVKFLPVADTRGVPFFLKGFVRDKFPKERERWVLLDWKGIFAQCYDFQPKSSNIMLLDRDGNVQHQTSVRQLDGKKLYPLLDKILDLLERDDFQRSSL
jgi:hypothetical protein